MCAWSDVTFDLGARKVVDVVFAYKWLAWLVFRLVRKGLTGAKQRDCEIRRNVRSDSEHD